MRKPPSPRRLRRTWWGLLLIGPTNALALATSPGGAPVTGVLHHPLLSGAAVVIEVAVGVAGLPAVARRLRWDGVGIALISFLVCFAVGDVVPTFVLVWWYSTGARSTWLLLVFAVVWVLDALFTLRYVRRVAPND